MRHLAWRRWTGFVVAALVMAPALARPSFAKEPDSSSESSARAWLGVYTQAMGQELRDEFNYRGEGVLVNRVVPDSPADRAGLQKGDIITAVGSRTVRSPETLSEVISGSKVGAAVSLRIVRDGWSQTLTAKLAAREDDQESPDTPVTPEAPDAPDAPEAPDHGDMGHGDMGHGDFSFDMPKDMDMGLPGVMRFMSRGRLGVRVQDLNPDLGSYFGVPDGKGVLITEVMKDTPAEKAGLKAGDVITRVGTHDVKDPGELVEALPSTEGKVSLTVVRKGSRRTIDAELGKAEGTMRVRRGTGPGQNFTWRSDGGPANRIQIRDLRGDADMRRQMEELRRQVEQLRAEIERMKK